MKPRFFEGAAGTGKTTRLMAELDVVLKALPLAEHQRVLALSKMHGSRRRLVARLGGVKGLGRRFDCATVDSFARRLVTRWRSLSEQKFGKMTSDTFESWCDRAGMLLALPIVRGWVARTYPIVMVDEIQDSKGGQMEILRGLGGACALLLAGDDFQDLDAAVSNEAIAWARSAGDLVPLSQIHRTSVQGLLDAAAALRGGCGIKNGPGFELASVPAAPLGAWHAAKFVAGRNKGESVALLTPVSAARSKFARDLVQRLGASPLGKPPHQIGPYMLVWERGDEEDLTDMIVRVGLADRPLDEIVSAGDIHPGVTGAERMLDRWLDRQRKLKAIVRFSVSELRERMRRMIQQIRTQRGSRRLFSAMTAHQAKNQEFDNVIVLWPYEVAGSEEKKRRLLYNAVTRARRRAIVILQNNAGNNDRLKKCPFVASTDAG